MTSANGNITGDTTNNLQVVATRARTALVLGATGAIGGEVARQLRDAGWQVRALKRAAALPSELRDGITWLRGDALVAADVADAAKGCSVIVHAVNPPGYRGWGKLVLPMIDNTIAAATAEHATILLPGTVYNFGPDAMPAPTETSAQNPQTRKGAIRVEMEQRLREFSESGGRTIIVRAGDFFGPKARNNNWFAMGLVKADQPVKRIANPGSPGIGHQWAYLPDVARAMTALLTRRESLDAFATFHVAGHWDADGSQMAAAIARVVARRTGRTPSIGAFPWWLIRVASPFVTTFREMLEMRYLWRAPLGMNGAKLASVLGAEPHTPLDEAVEATLEDLGCLQANERRPASLRLHGG